MAVVPAAARKPESHHRCTVDAQGYAPASYHLARVGTLYWSCVAGMFRLLTLALHGLSG